MIKIFTYQSVLIFSALHFHRWAAQDELRDSLKHELTIAKDDTSRVLIMAELTPTHTFGFRFNSFNSYANELLQLAQQIDFSRGEASCKCFGIGIQSAEIIRNHLNTIPGSQIAEVWNYVLTSI